MMPVFTFDRTANVIKVNLLGAAVAFEKAGESRMIQPAVPVKCNYCGWKGTKAQLLVLGSMGRIHCPECRADYGYADGVMPVEDTAR